MRPAGGGKERPNPHRSPVKDWRFPFKLPKEVRVVALTLGLVQELLEWERRVKQMKITTDFGIETARALARTKQLFTLVDKVG